MVSSLRSLLPLLALILTLVGGTLLPGCTKQGSTEQPRSPLMGLRDKGPATSDPEVAGRWLLAELVSPKGDVKHAQQARARLDELGGGGMLAHLARAMDDSVHGRLRHVSDHYLEAARAARTSKDPIAPLVGWYASRWGVAYRHSAPPKHWEKWQGFVTKAIAKPMNLGWRARGELVEWSIDQAYDRAEQKLEEVAAEQYGCVEPLRLAGPFGRNAPPDSYRNWPAERPGPWPKTWPKLEGRTPRILKTERFGCGVSTDEPVFSGIFYVETYLDLPKARNLLFAVQGALAIWVDDTLVLERDPREWGVWPRYGTALRLEAGRHRVLARIVEPDTSMRIMNLDGTPAKVKVSLDAAAPYSTLPPEKLADPNVLSPFIAKGRARPIDDELTRFLAAEVAHLEGQDDVASVLLEPLVVPPSDASGPALLAAATYVEGDPIYDRSKTEDLIRGFHEQALKKDPGLWAARLSMILTDAGRKSPTEAIRPLAKLAKQYPEVATIGVTLATLYGELGWSAEHTRTVKGLLEKFPTNLEVLYAASEVYRGEGNYDRAKDLEKRILELDPDSEVELNKALAARDYDAALKELKRLGKRRPDRKDIAERVHDVMVRAGNTKETWKKLEAAIEKEPKSVRARLDYADAKYAAGETSALVQALVATVEAGGNPVALEAAIDLLEGVTELEPYRVDARKVIAEYEAAGQPMPGTAARVLDYAAVKVRSDGSARRLTHEVIKIQSPEAIGRFAEQRQLGGIVLKMRVIKQDGQVLEPVRVAGKPTVTFPHLEVGDYIETEHIESESAQSAHGIMYVGPRWFFREEQVAYWHSEFVVSAPTHKELIIETRGNVPPPKVSERDGTTVRRWLVQRSPAAPNEPLSAPITEFLPSVHVGWGVNLKQRLRRFNDSLANVTPVDPRIQRIARKIVKGIPDTHPTERVKALYRWTLENVEDGKESDGRRVIVGKSGNRWRGFITLCVALDIEAQYVLAENRLAEPAQSPLSQAQRFNQTVLRVKAGSGKSAKTSWVVLSNKYTPFGYVPEQVQGSQGYVLGGAKPVEVTIPKTGLADRMEYEGEVELAANGSAKLKLTQRFRGKYAIGLRSALAGLPESRLRDVLESRLLGRVLRGARLIKYEIENRDRNDAPLAIVMHAEMSIFAQKSGGALVIAPPFSPRVGQLASLPQRKTPILIADATRQNVKLVIKLPKGSKLFGKPVSFEKKFGDHSAVVRDSLKGNVLTLDRELVIAAGRIQPKDYAAFQQFTRLVDTATLADVRIDVP